MDKISDLLKKYNLKSIKYEKKGNVLIVTTKDNKYVIKKKIENKDIYDYLYSRNFNYIPKVISDKNDSYEIKEYIEEVDMPDEQKLYDMVELLSLLHVKTTYFNEVDNFEYQTIYDDLNNNISYLFTHYNDVITLIETKVFMSPSEYLLARNISKIFNRLNEVKYDLDKWYEIVKDKEKTRYVVLYNNLDLSHFIRNETSYFINWDKSKIGMPIFDLYNLYLKNNNYNFNDLLNKYEEKYPLLDDEKMLLYILIKMPPLNQNFQNEFNNTCNIRKIIDSIDKTNNTNLPYNSKNNPN